MVGTDQMGATAPAAAPAAGGGIGLGAIGAMAGAGLLQSLFQMQIDKERDAKLRKQQMEDQARAQIAQAQQSQIAQAGQAGDREVNALQNLISVFQRAAR